MYQNPGKAAQNDVGVGDPDRIPSTSAHPNLEEDDVVKRIVALRM